MKKLISFLCCASVLLTPATAQQLEDGLKKLVFAAFEKNDSIKINNIRLQQNAIDQQTTRFSYLPKLSANATYTRLNDDITFPAGFQTLLMGSQRLLVKETAGLPFNSQLPSSIKLQSIAPIQAKEVFKITANTQWLLFSGFKVEYGLRALQHHQKAIIFLNTSQRTKLLLQVAELHDKLALLNASDSVINSSKKILHQQSKFIDAAIKNGLATPLERKKIELAKQRLELKITENQGARILVIEKLHQLTGTNLPLLFTLTPTLKPLILPTELEQAARPEIESLKEAIEACRFKQKMELTEYMPKLLAFGQYEFRKNDLTMLDPRWYIGLRLQWNIFDGFTARNNARKAALDERVFELQKQNAEELISLGQAKANQEIKTANQKIKMVQAQLSLAAETFEFVSKQYQNGLTTITELLNALNDLERARLDLQQAWYDQRRATLALADMNGTLLNNF